MRATIEAKSRAEASAISAGLEDPVLRACAVIVGVLRQLPTDRARRRVLEFATEQVSETAAAE